MNDSDAKPAMIEPPVFYTHAVALGVDIDHHESDLHLPVTAETTALVKTYRFRDGIRQFLTTREGREARWYAIPFAYQPFWDERHADRV